MAITAIAALPAPFALRSSPAQAASPAPEAEVAIRRGIELRRRGDDAAALAEFQRADGLAPSSRTQAQIGFAEQALGRWRDAEEHLVRALADGGDVWIRKNRPTLERSRAAVGAHLGSLEVLGGPAGAELRVDGHVLGRLPLARPLRVAAGTVGVEVRADGYLPTARSVTIAAGELTRETVSLQKIEGSPVPFAAFAPRLPSAPSVPAVAPAPPSLLSSGALARVGDGRAGDGDRDGGGGGAWRRPAAWVSLGGAVLFTGGLVAALVARRHYAQVVAARLGDGRCTQSADLFRGPAARDCADAAGQRAGAQTLGVIGGGVAAALAVAAVVLFATAPSR